MRTTSVTISLGYRGGGLQRTPLLHGGACVSELVEAITRSPGQHGQACWAGNRREADHPHPPTSQSRSAGEAEHNANPPTNNYVNL